MSLIEFKAMSSILDFEQRTLCSKSRLETLSGAEMHCMLCSRSCKADAGESGDLGLEPGPGSGFRTPCHGWFKAQSSL